MVRRFLTTHPAARAALVCLLGLAMALWFVATPAKHWGWRFIEVWVVCFACYLLVLRLVAKGWISDRAQWLAAVMVIAVLLRIVAADRCPQLSRDVWRYVWDGKVANAGINPYRYTPCHTRLRDLRGRHDWHFRLLNSKDVPNMYPPAAALLFTALERVKPDSAVPFRATFALFDLACIPLLWLMLGWVGRRRQWALAYAWHPLVVVEFARGGHVDSTGIFFLLLAFALMPWDRPRPGWRGPASAAALATAVMLKGFAVLALPFLARRAGWRYLAVFALVCIAFAVPYLSEWRSLPNGFVTYARGWHTNGSIFAVVDAAFRTVSRQHIPLAKTVFAASLVALTIWLLRRGHAPTSWRGTPNPLSDAAIVFPGALLLGAPVFPWYVAWTVPFLCFWPVRGLLAFSALAAIGWYSKWTGSPGVVVASRLIAYLSIYALLVWDFARWRRRQGTSEIPGKHPQQ